MSARFREYRDFVPVGVDFLRQLRWRFGFVLVFCLFDAGMLLSGHGVTTPAAIVAFAPYLAWVASLWALVRSPLGGRLPTMPLILAAYAADLLFVVVQMHLNGGGWWHGPSFYMIGIMLAASTVPPRALVLVTLAGVIMFVGLAWLQVSGVLPPPLWGDFPRVDGNQAFLVNYAGLGALVLVGTAVIQARLTSRMRRVQQRHRAVLDASPYVVLTLDAHDRITSASRIAETITGRSAKSLTGTDFKQLFDVTEQDGLADHLQRARTGERFRREMRAAGELVDGRSRWYGAGFSRVESDGADETAFVILRDLTEERQQREDNAQLAHQLEEARRLELVGRLVSGVAHELNNPLAAILALTEQLEHDSSREQVVADARVIHEQARRARSIVRDLLQVVRAPAPLTLTTVDARTLVERAVAGTEARPERTQVAVHLAVPVSVCPIETEEGSIEQVITNLVVNALQATPTGGRIDVTVRDASDACEIEVRDSGPGFTDVVRTRLFEPFFTTRPAGHGTGLGLAVSRAIVQRHGGTLEAQSSPEGACFVVRLPRGADIAMFVPHAAVALHTAAPHATEPQATAPSAEHPARRVLLIDDEASIRLALARWFERQGWTVTHCVDGARALALLLGSREHFDLVISDLKMPGLSGMDVHAALRDARPDVLDRFIIATGDTASAEVAAFLSTVSSPVLEKPFALTQLAELLDTMAPRAAA